MSRQAAFLVAHIFPSFRARRTMQAILGLSVLLHAIVGPALPALAYHNPHQFELDGNAMGASGGEDWSTIYNGTSVALGTAFVSEPPPDATYFKEGGSKDVNDVSLWKYSAANVSPDKDEITQAFAAAYGRDGDLIVNFGLARYDNNGSAMVGFRFFHNRIGLNPDGTFSGVHADNDILVLAEFTNGGSVTTIKAYRWWQGKLDPKPIADGADCGAAGATHILCGIVNKANEVSPWPHQSKFGAANQFPPATFFEGALNVTRALKSLGGNLDNPCFDTFLAESRSSHELKAQLKDFALGSFQTCKLVVDKKASVQGQTPVDEVTIFGGGTVTYHYEVTNPNPWPVTITSAADDKVGNLTFSPTTIPAGGKATASATKTFPPVSACQTEINTVTVTINGTTTAQDTAVTKNCPADPKFQVNKTVSTQNNAATAKKSIQIQGGGTVYYFYTLKNTGTVPFDVASAIDDKLGGVTFDKATLQPGETAKSTLQKTFSPLPPGSCQTEENTLSVTVSVGGVTFGPKSAQASVQNCTPSIKVEKTASAVNDPATGQKTVSINGGTVYYFYKVTNTGRNCSAGLRNVLVRSSINARFA